MVCAWRGGAPRKKELRKSKKAKKSVHSSAQPVHEVRLHRSEMLEPGIEPGSQLYQAGVLTAVGLLLILENTALQSGIRSFFTVRQVRS